MSSSKRIAFHVAERLRLRLQPRAYQRRGGPQQLVRRVGAGLHGQQEFGDAQQMRGQDQRPAGGDDLDHVPRILDARLEESVVVQNDRQQAVAARVGRH